MNNQKFSVLMSVYHNESSELLRHSLNSIMDQTVVTDEIVLIEDGILTEDLYSVLSQFQLQYPGIMNRVALKQNQGLGIALAIGIEHCKHDLVARMDSDDICVPTRFEWQLEIFKQKNNIDVVGGWIEEFDKNISDLGKYRTLPEFHNELRQLAKWRCPLNHMTLMFKKSVIIKAGNYQPFHHLEDYYLWIRLLINGAQFYNIQKVLVYARVGNKMHSRRRGFTYFKNEINLYNFMLRTGFINLFHYLIILPVRLTFRLMPALILKSFYNSFLRYSK